LEWIGVTNSTLVSAVAFDEAAERIFVKLHSGKVWLFDDCTSDLWEAFVSSGISKGEFMTGVLERRPYRELDV
jgi:hypothetical protein